MLSQIYHYLKNKCYNPPSILNNDLVTLKSASYCLPVYFSISETFKYMDKSDQLEVLKYKE